MNAHTYLLPHKPLKTAWTLRLVELGIAVLAGFGLYYFFLNWQQDEFAFGLVALGGLTGTATIYAFGYLWCLPDVFGGIQREETRDLRQRWSDFAFLTTFIAILVIVGAYIRAIWLNHYYVFMPAAIALVAACCWLLPGCVMASETYLSWTMPSNEIKGASGWRAQVRRATRAWGNCLVRLAGIKPALATGVALALSSLLLPLGDTWFNDTPGYKIVAGSRAWPMPGLRDVPQAGVLLIQGLREVYVLGLVVAVTALLGLLPGKFGRTVQESRGLAILAGAIAMLHISNSALGFVYNELRFVLWMAMWALPIAFWLIEAHGDKDHWDRTRVALMIFCLPIFLIGLALLVTFTYMSPGIGSFVIGMLLVWWGLVQSKQKNSQQKASPAPDLEIWMEARQRIERKIS